MTAGPLRLGVNIDHVATIRNARGSDHPDPARAAEIVARAGGNGITVHLREDRRHIRERDVRMCQEALQTRVNLEMAATEEMVRIACEVRPADCCLVPERRAEVTTEGGLDVVEQRQTLVSACARLAQAGIRVSLFIDPEPAQIEAAAALGVPVVELHTGAYAEARGEQQARELRRVQEAARHGARLGLRVHAGHGLNYHNVQAIAAIDEIVELNIGHAIIARAVIDGLAHAVREMKRLMLEARAAAVGPRS